MPIPYFHSVPANWNRVKVKRDLEVLAIVTLHPKASDLVAINKLLSIESNIKRLLVTLRRDRNYSLSFDSKLF